MYQNDYPAKYGFPFLAVLPVIGSVVSGLFGGSKSTTTTTPAPAVQTTQSKFYGNLEWLLPTGVLLIVVIAVVALGSKTVIVKS